MAEFVTVDRGVAQGIAVLRIARPPLNLIDLQVALEVAGAAEEIAADPGISAVVVYGDERVFSAGDEMAELAKFTPSRRRPWSRISSRH